MRRYIKYILLSLITIILVVSCLEIIESPQPMVKSETLTLVPRVKSFMNQYVTKAYDSSEDDIKSLHILVFDNEGKYVYSESITDASSITINKSMLYSPSEPDRLNSSTVVMIANMSLGNIKNGNDNDTLAGDKSNLTLADLENYFCEFGTPFLTSVPSTGLPMIGGIKNVNLTATRESQEALSIDLKILYSKVNIEIDVENGTENEGDGMTFNLTSASISNIAKATALAIPDEKDSPKLDFLGNEIIGPDDNPMIAETSGSTNESYYISTATNITTVGNQAYYDKNTPSNCKKITATFYIPESHYNHNSNLNGIYPDNNWINNPLYDQYKQHYKPKIVAQSKSTGSGKPTFITLTGTYKDYRNTVWDVSYTVYLGKNNYDNFHVDRNSEYTNYITIKGIRNNDGYVDTDANGNIVGDKYVWVDHRVDASLGANQGADDCITITRETLIDAHIEVRPLRVKLAGTKYTEAAIYLPKYPKTGTSDWVQIDEIMGGDNENWIAIENNNGLQNKGIQYSSNGKRKYFTTSLMEELHAESSGIKIDSDANRYIPLRDGDCAWIYFDENGTSNARRARIDVVFYYYSGEKKNSVTESYYVYQSGYTSVGDLKIENYEEYLHSYDSADKYGLNTSPADYTQQGLEWGHKGKVFSQNNIVSQINIGSVLNNTTANISLIKDLRYDYFHNSDISATQIPYLYSANYNWSALTSEQLNKETGLYFTERATAIEPDPITIIDMSTPPSSAYQYCLSKNKFREDADGNHTLDIHWYLPDVNELKTVLGVNNLGADMSTDSYYWSSQPAYTDRLDGDIIKAIESVFGNSVILDENPDQARAVSISVIEDKDRNTQNRIRCFYSATSLTANMSDRVPSGLGDLIKIPLKAYESYTTSTLNKPAYFYDWLSDLDDTHKKYDTPTEPSYAYPKGEDANTFDDFVFNNVRYYTKNPALKASWSTNVTSQTLYYYPGLSPFEVQVAGLVYRESDQLKTYSRTETEFEGEYINALPSNEQLAAKTNTYTDISDYVVLSFSAGTNESNSPTYAYRREDRATKYTYTKNWQVPEYEEKNINTTSGYEKGEIQLQDDLASARYALLKVGDNYEYNDKTYTISAKRERWIRNEYYITLKSDSEEFEIQLEDKLASVTYASYDVGDDYLYDGVLFKITSKRDRWLRNQYYFTLGPTTIRRTGYLYKTGTGCWGTESGPDDGSPEATAEVVDKLEFFGGNSFTITAQSGYRIKSIKVNFSDNNGVKNMIGGDWSYRNLRLVLGNQTLPTTSTPTYMSYSGDGESGWYQWTAPTVEDYATSVTLKLAAYTPTSASLRPTSYEYEAASKEDGYQSDFETSIVIDSFEIRIEKVKTSNTN